MLGIVMNRVYKMFDNQYQIVIYDEESKALKVIMPKGGCTYGECLALDLVYYDVNSDTITIIADDRFLLYVDDLIMIYKEYLKLARDIKIDFLIKNDILLEYNNNIEAKEKFKHIASDCQNTIHDLEQIERILKAIITRLKRYVTEKDLYFLFYKNGNVDEKKHDYFE